jgi:hypothetical protein
LVFHKKGEKENFAMAAKKSNPVGLFLEFVFSTSNWFHVALLIGFLGGIFGFGYFLVDGFIPDVTVIRARNAESLSAETGARFYVASALEVKTMDDLSTKWRPKLTAGAVEVLLPPGVHAFVLDFQFSDGNTNWSAKDLKISADFKIGKYYRFDYSLDKTTSKIS